MPIIWCVVCGVWCVVCCALVLLWLCAVAYPGLIQPHLHMDSDTVIGRHQHHLTTILKQEGEGEGEGEGGGAGVGEGEGEHSTLNTQHSTLKTQH